MIKEYFNTDIEKDNLIEKYKDKYITDIAYLRGNENYIIFSETPNKEPFDTIEQIQNKISILTEENENLKQELALTQDAVNEILFMMMNMEVK